VSAFATTKTGAEEDPRLPSARLEEPPRAVALLLASWVIMLQGALIVIFLPVLVFKTEDVIPPRDIATCGVVGLAALVGGALVYAPRRWTWWTALASTLACAAYLLAVGGLASAREGYVAAALTTIAVVLLLLGYPAAGNTEALSMASARIPFRIKVTAVWIAIFFVLGLFLSLSALDTSFMRDVGWYITKGLEWTIILSVCAIVLATILALFGALGRLSRNPVAYGVSGFYTSFFRGTPLIVQLFLIYLALPEIGSNLDRPSVTQFLSLTVFVAGVIGLGLNYGAYMTEIFRAGIQSVGHGQAEAADALAMTYMQRMRRVVLPQAIRVIIPPTGNEFIAMMKDTALVSFLGVQITRTELFGRATLAFSANVTKRLETLLIAAALYWLLTSIFTFFQARLERRISKGYVRTTVQTGTGRKRTQFVPVGGGGGPGGGAGVVGIEVPIEDEPPA
jgi:polar amino acid transport system permease protein